MEWLTVALEEYKSVRQESLESLARQQTIGQYTLASVGVSVAAGTAAADRSPAVAALLLMGVLPTIVLLAAALMAAEARRVTRAGRFLRGLEADIAERFAPDVPPLRWETAIALSTRVTRHRLLGSTVLVAAMLSGPVLGAVVLADRGLWWGFGVGVTVDSVMIIALGVGGSRFAGDLQRELAEPVEPGAPPGSIASRP